MNPVLRWVAVAVTGGEGARLPRYVPGDPLTHVDIIKRGRIWNWERDDPELTEEGE